MTIYEHRRKLRSPNPIPSPSPCSLAVGLAAIYVYMLEIYESPMSLLYIEMMTVKPRYGRAINISDDSTVMHRDSFALILKSSRRFLSSQSLPEIIARHLCLSLFSRIDVAGIATGSSTKNGTVILNVCTPRVALKYCITSERTQMQLIHERSRGSRLTFNEPPFMAGETRS